jgi:deoxyribodipyrimidine photolyase-related protein
MAVRDLLVVLGDQLDPRSAVRDGAEPALDVVWMAEAAGEADHVPSHKVRTALFLSAMRHHAADLRAQGWTVDYQRLDDPGAAPTLGGALAAAIARHHPGRVVMVEAGEWRVAEAIRAAVGDTPLEIRPERHFLVTLTEFAAWIADYKQPRMEWFYRWMRQRTGVLMDDEGPLGGRWNFDAENRSGFAKTGPGPVPAIRRFPPDAITREVLALVAARFPEHPGSLEHFDWPVTPAEAQLALDDFIQHRLADFGRWQDARWDAEPLLWHSRISAALNLKLLDPRQVIAAAEAAYHDGRAPLNAVEGFIRQILGWREWVRGIYWRHMPEYAERNALGADQPLPAFYWTGDAPMACLARAVQDTLATGYAHHIQRLMVTGLYALLLGVRPKEVHAWYLGIYVDAVEWVELPNTLGMALYADGGVMASKPYAASGAYHARMGDSCARCRFDPAQAEGDRACPYTTLYWDFLARHADRLRRNPRMANQVRNLDRIPADRLARIRARAAQIISNGGLPP